MATPTWSQLTYLTANQQTKMAAFATEGAKIGVRGSPPPDLTNLTWSQAKAARQSMRELHDLINNAERGIQYAIEFYRKKATDDADAANP